MRKDKVIGIPCISLIILILCAFLLTYGSPAHGAADVQKRPVTREPALEVEMLKILPVLEGKIGSRELLEKSKEKIYAMDNREVRLIAALCEKISDNRQGFSSDIAFLLVTALIVLS